MDKVMDKPTIDTLISNMQLAKQTLEQTPGPDTAGVIATLERLVAQLRTLRERAPQHNPATGIPKPDDGAMIDASTWVSLHMALTGCDRQTAEAQLLARVEGGLVPDADMRFARESILPGPASQPTHRHTKGGLYCMIARGYIEETLEPCIVYRDFREGYVWVRPEDNFMDGRFTALVDEDALPQRIPLKPRKD